MASTALSACLLHSSFFLVWIFSCRSNCKRVSNIQNTHCVLRTFEKPRTYVKYYLLSFISKVANNHSYLCIRMAYWSSCDMNCNIITWQIWVQPVASKWRARDETKHVDFGAQTLWALAHVQESPLDKIYVLLMIFIGPLAQSSGRLPRNLKESCFRLVVRMQRVIKLREGMVKAKKHLSSTMSPVNLTILIPFTFFFLRL